jgi:hypothetical protein
VVAVTVSAPAFAVSLFVTDGDGKASPSAVPSTCRSLATRLHRSLRFVTVEGLRSQNSKLHRAVLVLDVGVALGLAAVSGLVRAGARVNGSCTWAAVAMVVIATVGAVYFLVVRPYESRLEQLVSCVQSSLVLFLSVITAIAITAPRTVSDSTVETAATAADGFALASPFFLAVPSILHLFGCLQPGAKSLAPKSQRRHVDDGEAFETASPLLVMQASASSDATSVSIVKSTDAAIQLAAPFHQSHTTRNPLTL